MTKSAKHKKLRKAEFQKVKLKVGKKLKKPQNETRTDFKSRKIIIKEQLDQGASSALVTKKNVSLKVLVGKLTHHNDSIRRDLLKGITDIIKLHSKELLAPDASLIVVNVIPLILDADETIRRSTIKVIDLLLAKLGSLINPYLLPLTSHLSCAMVHLNVDVQGDSLNLMTSLLMHVPSHVARKANELLENFLSLLARKIRTKSGQPTLTSKNLVSLNFNPSSNLSTIRWRIKLLGSLSSYLGAILNERGKVLKCQPDSLRELIILGCLPSSSIYNSNSSADQLEILTIEEKACGFALSIISLLFEVWAEVDMGSDYSMHGNPLSILAMNVLSCISQIIQYIWNIVEIVTGCNPTECRWFMTAIKEKFSSRLVVGFPYSSHQVAVDNLAYSKDGIESDRLSKEHLKENEQVSYQCQKMNIGLASIALLLSREDLKLHDKIICYCADIMSMDSASPCHREVVKMCCSFLSSCSLPLGIKILESSLESYRNNKKFRKDLTTIPLKAINWDCEKFWKCEAFSQWVRELLKEFSGNPNNTLVFDVLLQFKLRNIPGFWDMVEDMNMTTIII